MNCLSDQQLQGLLEGSLPSEQTTRIDRHLEGCELCLSTLKRIATRSAPWTNDSEDQGGSTSTTDDDFVFEQTRLRSLADRLKSELFDETDIPIDSGAEEDDDPSSSEDLPLPNIPGLQILRRIGEGGMGIVYEAFDPSLKRRVAVKMLSGLKRSEESFLRMRTEAEAAARLSHPGIVQVYRFDEADTQPVIVMEHIGGESLAQRLAGQPQPPRDAAALTRKLADALHYAHQRQVIHRDLKPSNILFETTDDRTPLSELAPKIADFGLAKVLDTDIETTRDGQLIGTPTYAAPEQLRQGRGAIGPAADVYSLGAVLHTMLTGHPPLQSDDLWKTVAMVLETEPISPRRLQPGVPIDLDTITLRCLMKEPDRRYRDAGELAADLRRFLADEPIEARPIGRLERTWRWARRNPAVALTSSALAILFIATMAAAVVAAVHFRGLVDERDRQRLKAETSLLEARHAVVDSFRALGSEYQNGKHYHLAALCFSQGIDQLPEDDPRRLDNQLRAASALRLTPRPLRLLGQPAANRLEDVAYHPSSRWLIAYPQDRKIPPTLWDIDAGAEVVFPTTFGSVSALAWDTTGHKLCVGRDDGRVLIATFPNPMILKELSGDVGVTAIAVSSDGKRIAAAGTHQWSWWKLDDDANVVAQQRRDREVPTGEPRPSPIVDLNFSPDGKFLVSVDDRQQLVVLDTDNPKGPPHFAAKCGAGAVGISRILPRFDPQGRLVVWSEGELDRIDLAKGASVRTEPTPPAFFCEVCAKSGDVIIGGDNIFLQYTDTGINRFGVDTRVSACWLSDGGVVTGSNDSDCLIRWVAGLKDGQGWPLFQPDGFVRLRQSPDGRLLTTISNRNQLRVWAFPTPPDQPAELVVGKDVTDESVTFESVTDGDTTVVDGDVAYGSLSADGQQILVRSDRHGIRIHSTADGVASTPTIRPDGRPIFADWWGSGQEVLTVSRTEQGCAVDIWDGRSGMRRKPTVIHRVMPADPHNPLAQTVCALADARKIAYITEPVRDVVLLSIDEPTAKPLALGLPAQRLMNAGSAGRLIVVTQRPDRTSDEWVLIDGANAAILGRYRTSGSSPPLPTPSGDRVAYCDDQHRFRFVETKTGKHLSQILPHPHEGTAEGFSEDGKILLTIGTDRYARLWDIEGKNPLMLATKLPRDCRSVLAAGGRAIVTVASDLTYNVLSSSDGQPLGLFNRLTPNGGSLGNQRIRLSAARGGRLIAVGGLPSVVLIDLDEQLRRLPWQPERLNQYCQLVSGHRLNSGQAIPIDVDEWDAMWRDGNPMRHADQQIDKAIRNEPEVPDLTDRR